MDLISLGVNPDKDVNHNELSTGYSASTVCAIIGKSHSVRGSQVHGHFPFMTIFNQYARIMSLHSTLQMTLSLACDQPLECICLQLHRTVDTECLFRDVLHCHKTNSNHGRSMIIATNTKF